MVQLGKQQGDPMTAQLAAIWEVLDAMKEKIELQNACAKEIRRHVKLIVKVSTPRKDSQND
jgi:hypothetical protein